MTNAYPWLNYLHSRKTTGYGQNQGYGMEMGQDIGMPLDTPINSPVAGPVVGAGYYAGGGVVTIRAIIYGVLTDVYFQHLDCIYVKYNDFVHAGDPIGTSGGALRGQGNPTCGHYSDSHHSSGPHVEIGFNYGAIGNRKGAGGIWGKLPHPSASRDPLPWLEKIASGQYSPEVPAIGTTQNPNPPTPWNDVLGTKTGLSGALQTIHLTPNDDVTALLVLLDQLCEVQNPVARAVLDTQNDQPANVIDETVDFFKFLAIDSLISVYAFIFRAVFMVVGFILMYKVISSFIDFEQVQATAFQAARVATLVGG